MKTDKNTLFRAIGEIDDKYVCEILEEDASAANNVVSFEAAQASTNAKKKASSNAKKFLTYYLPAVAALLLCVVFVKSFLTSRDSAAGNYAAESAAPAAASENSAETDSVQMMETNGGDAASFDIAETAAAESSAETTDASYAAGSDKEEESLFIDGMPNPFVDCESLKEACEAAGVSLNLPDEIGPGLNRIYRAMPGKMVEVIFEGASGEQFRIRKASTDEMGRDISGDYNEYSVSTNVDGALYAATLNGNAEDEVSMAYWCDDEYSYSITFENPVSVKEATDIINSIMSE